MHIIYTQNTLLWLAVQICLSKSSVPRRLLLCSQLENRLIIVWPSKTRRFFCTSICYDSDRQWENWQIYYRNANLKLWQIFIAKIFQYKKGHNTIKLHLSGTAAVQYLPNDITSGLWLAKTAKLSPYAIYWPLLAHTKLSSVYLCRKRAATLQQQTQSEEAQQYISYKSPHHWSWYPTDSCLALEFWLNTKLKTISSSSRRWFAFLKCSHRLIHYPSERMQYWYFLSK